MINPGFRHHFSIAILLSAGLITSCGGTKMLKETQPIQTTQPLAASSDQRVEAILDWVIVRDGPGTWARNADWDEYLLSVSNLSDQPVKLMQLTIVDSLDTRIEPQLGRKQLVKNSKQTARRYKDFGIKVKAGRGVGTMLVAGAVVTAVGIGTATAVAATSLMSGAAAAGSAGAAAGGLLLLGPALAVGGIVRGVNNSKVNNEIELRQTLLPLEIPAGEKHGLNIFFPLAPSPNVVELVYVDATGERSLIIDTSKALDGLHIDAPKN